MIIMKCICCGEEIDYAAAFMTAKDGHMWAVCRECVSTLTAAGAREAQDRAEMPDETEQYPEPEYDPGLIEEGL